MTIKYPVKTERDFLYIYLSLYNALLPQEQQLTQSEIELIIGFALLPDSKFHYQRFSTLAKEHIIRDNPHLTKININNKLYSLLDKKFLKRDEDSVIYMPQHLLTTLSSFKQDPNFQINLKFISNNDSTQDNSDS